MAFTIATFRSAFTEFQDTSKYPDAMIDVWSALAIEQVNPCRWKSQTDLGVMLYTAHECVLASQNAATANNGGAPGAQSGPANSKTVGTVTVAYDTQQTAEKNAGYWNLTTYGKQFFNLTRKFGAGSVQL